MMRLVGAVLLAVVTAACTSTEAEVTTTPPATTQVPPTSTTTSVPPPMSYGDDADLDQLWDQCAEGNFASCDTLLARSPAGSDYEAFAVTCGERNEALTEGLCAELHTLGAVEVAADGTIRIAALQFHESGAGSDQLRGIEMAVEDYGAIHEHSIELLFEESGCNAERGASAAVAVASQPDVIGVIGTTCSAAAATVSPILSEEGIVMITGSSSDARLTSDLREMAGVNWFPGFYRTYYNDLHVSFAAAAFISSELAATTVAVLHVQDGYLGELARGFKAEFETLGGQAEVFEVPGDITDLRPVFSDVEAISPDTVYVVGQRPVVDLYVQQVGNSETLAAIPTVVGSAEEDVMRIPEAEGMYFMRIPFEFGDSAGFEGITFDELTAEFREKYGERPAAPVPLYPYSYDATILLLSAIEAVATEQDGVLTIDRRLLREALTATLDAPGVTGLITCDEFGDCGPETVFVVRNTRPSRPEVGLANVVFTYPDSSVG